MKRIMEKGRQNKGFTIVELLIVVVVSVLLSTVMIVAYRPAQAKARDVQIRDAADKIHDAMLLWSSRNNGAIILGGAGSTAAATATGCSNGSTGAVDPGVHTCTVGSGLVAMGYLPSNLFTNLPPNKRTGIQQRFMMFPCTTDSSGKKQVLFYTLERPTEQESTAFDQVGTVCGIDTTSLKANQNMQAHTIVQF